MRILTRADFDGLACSVLLKELGLMDNWLYVHPKDVQDGKYPGDPDDIVANVPYIPGCGLWFDHHTSEQHRIAPNLQFNGAFKAAKSAARVIWEYYGGHERFGTKFDEMLHYVDKVDSGDLTREEIASPTGWILLGFIMDPRTGLGRYRYFTISNYRLMEALIEYCRSMPVNEILAVPDVRERVELYFQRERSFQDMVSKRAELMGNVVVLDLREQEEIAPGNRFSIYAMYPDANISLQAMWGKQQQNIVISLGHSILNRTCSVDVGALLLEYGGGGHLKVGTCQIPAKDADYVIDEIVARCRER